MKRLEIGNKFYNQKTKKNFEKSNGIFRFSLRCALLCGIIFIVT